MTLSQFLQDAAAAVRSPIAGRGQELVLRLPPEHVLFMADRVRLDQIAANLLNNASKYTGGGGTIELSGARAGSEVVIRCKDNGRGIPLEMQQTIFEPFARVQMARESAEAGVGIGLSLVKRLVELHGGTVSVESGGLGTGSEFVVRLPLVEPPPAQRTAGEAGPAPRSRRKLSIVVVEDNPDVAQSLAIALDQAGHKATLFADGPSALAGLARTRPTAVLLDIGLPGMDGYELASRLREKPNLRHTLFIALSGFKRRVEAGRAHDDFDHYFVKPVDLDMLLTLIQTRARAGEADGAKAPRAPKPPQALRVLLVEDNAELAAATAELLRHEGVEVRIALSGQEAVKAAADYRPELTVCDLHLPDMPGPEVVRALRSNRATRRTRAVILTALHESEVRMLSRRFKGTAIDRFVSKPLTSDKFRSLLAEIKLPRR